MSKEEYAEQTRMFAEYFRKGKQEERKRILELIDGKIEYYGLDKKMLTDFGRGFYAALEELQKDIPSSSK